MFFPLRIWFYLQHKKANTAVFLCSCLLFLLFCFLFAQSPPFLMLCVYALTLPRVSNRLRIIIAFLLFTITNTLPFVPTPRTFTMSHFFALILAKTNKQTKFTLYKPPLLPTHNGPPPPTPSQLPWWGQKMMMIVMVWDTGMLLGAFIHHFTSLTLARFVSRLRTNWYIHSI